jgi:transposase
VRSRVELFEQIRRDRRVEQLSIRELADRHGVHRRTVRQALASAVPPPRKTYPPRRRPAIDPYVTVIDGWLIEDRDAPRKQRHTARRVWQRFVAEHEVTLAEVTVSRYVARRRGELGLDHREVSIPQMHLADAEAEVDFGEFYATVAGVVIKVWMFVMRLSHSGKAFDVAFGTQAQEAFLEGHVLAFEHFGGVPARVRYDNLKPAVVRVLKGRDRTESERFTALRSHYGFDSFFCRPGIEGAHEKGGVEGEIGRFCRRHLVPVPKVDSLAALNERIAAGDVHDDGRVITGRPVTIAAAFAAEAPTLMPLPVEAFDPARQLETRVDNRARVSVRQCFYSVPARFAGRRLPIRLTARTVEIYDGAKVIARHERAVGRYVEVLTLDHYLEVLKMKPGGLPGATALAQAKASRAFTASHQAYWDAPPTHPRRQCWRPGVDRDSACAPHHDRRRADRGDGPSRRLWLSRPGGGVDRGPPPHRAGRTRRPDRRAGPLRPTDTHPYRLRPATDQERNMTTTKVSTVDAAAQASIGAAAREPHLPTVRTEAARLAEIAGRERQTHLAYLAEVLAGEVDDRTERRRTRRINDAKFPRLKRLADFNVDAVASIQPPPSATSPPGTTWTPANRLSCSATPAPARVTYSLVSGLPPASKAAGSATSPPRSWSTSSSKPPTNASCPASPAADCRFVWLPGVWTSWATSRSTPAARSCCFRSSPNAKNGPRSRSRSRPTCRSANGASVFPDPRLVAAIADRVTFNAHILETGTESYRLRTSKTAARGKNGRQQS